LIIISEVTKQTNFLNSVRNSAWEFVSLILADTPLESELLKFIINYIVELAKINTRVKRKISKIRTVYIKKCAGDRDGGKEVD